MKDIEKIWKDYSKRLFLFIKSRVEIDEAADILQDIFLKIHKNIDSLKNSSSLESWLFQITRNSIYDYYRSRRTSDEMPRWVEASEEDEEDKVKGQLISCLLPFIEELPEKYRRALILSEIDGLSQKELAKIENLSLSGAKSRVQRGRALLRGFFNECCEIELKRGNRLTSCHKRDGKCNSC